MRAKNSIIDPIALSKAVLYDPETGVFTWPNGRAVSLDPMRRGSRLGPITGYRFKVLGVKVRAHRLAWFYCYGYWPDNQIDHINRNPADNRIANLREATRSQNQANRPVQKNNKLGVKGVCASKGGFLAYVGRKGKPRWQRWFPTAGEAKAARDRMAGELHGDFASV